MNAADYCECDPPWISPVHPPERAWERTEPTRLSIDDLLATLRADRRDFVRGVLSALEAQGVWLETPEGERDDYVNVRPSNFAEQYRLFSVTRRTGRFEFGKYSYTMARSEGLAHLFDELEGAKAATNPTDTAHSNAIVSLALAELDRRRSGF